MILALIILSILFTVWLGFFRRKEAPASLALPPVVYAFPRVEINWQVLESFRGKTPQPLLEVKEFEGEFGRSNPFIPY